MSRLALLVLACAAATLAVCGCSSEEAAEGGPAPKTAATGPGDSKAGTANQLSINPDYKK